MANYYTLFSFEITDLTPAEAEWVTATDLDQYAADEEVGLQCSVQIVDDGLWISEDESGSPEDAANVVQAFLAQFRPDEIVSFSWAETCSAPRIDAFGGGACVVTATEARFMNVAGWIADQVAAHT
jgi:hypothetical protein